MSNRPLLHPSFALHYIRLFSISTNLLPPCRTVEIEPLLEACPTSKGGRPLKSGACSCYTHLFVNDISNVDFCLSGLEIGIKTKKFPDNPETIFIPC